MTCVYEDEDEEKEVDEEEEDNLPSLKKMEITGL